ncbi:hypothetical protein ACP0HM_24450 [Escherichia coli]
MPLKYQYLLGRDILVAPLHEEGRSDWTLYLPEDNWVHARTGETFHGGEITVEAPIGKPPVFYRADSEWAALFASLKKHLIMPARGETHGQMENNDESHHNGRSGNFAPAL